MRSSYSQNNTYIACPKHWYWSYKERFKTPDISSALFFGSAVDDAVMALLEGRSDYMNIFESRCLYARNYFGGKDIAIFDNLDIKYSRADFDADVLKPEDLDDMKAWAKQLKLSVKDPIKTFKLCAVFMSDPSKGLKKSHLIYYSRCSWLSLKRKGEIMIQSFVDQILPKVKKVIAVQKRASIVDPVSGDVISGFIDFVAEFDGYDKPIIVDLKTSSKIYPQYKIDLTDQLTLYYAMAGEDYNTDLVAYIVLPKSINKEEFEFCKDCGNKKASKHRTCDAVVNNVRCHGEWLKSKKIEPVTQFLVQQKTEEDAKNLLTDYGNIMLAMKNDIIYKNMDKCNNWYGGQCPYYNACHKNDTSGLIKK